MKRFSFVLLFMALILPSIVLGEDYTSMTDEQLHSQMNEIRNELAKRELVAGEKLLLWETNGVSLYLTGDYTCDDGELRLNTITVNNTDKDIKLMVSIDHLSVNGWDVNSNYSLDTNAGQKRKGYIKIYLNGADIQTYEEVEEIIFRFSFKFAGDEYKWIDSDPIPVQFNKES